MRSIDARRLLRAVVAAEEYGLAGETVAAIFPVLWGHCSPLSTTEDLVRILEDAEVAHAKIVSRLDDSGLDDRLTQKSQQAGELRQ
jgi:hypothetical protein